MKQPLFTLPFPTLGFWLCLILCRLSS